jgi:hypothetical protein
MVNTIVSVRKKISDLQAILYTLSKPESQMKFKRDPQLLTAIERGDVGFVRKWFRTDLDSYNLKELRDLASRVGIYPVYGKTRGQLILLIKDKRDV